MKANWIAIIVAVLLPWLVLSGCIPIPLGNSGPFIPQDMPQELRDKIVLECWTREQVIELLGSPDVVSDDVLSPDTRAIGYWRCEPYEILVLPYFMKERWETCFLYGFWFDVDGHAVRVAIKPGTQGQVSMEHERDLTCPAWVWLSTPGGGCARE